ncbi:unnamed protein product [Owenia fusiformis]|uniref:Uncharacterized protein n=1 Tax=Owenia fusiformis TaxID=6347 RepID=A0A8J1TMJ6_OWEFU|nr:unnamed protein product [Owenia fusiformis]
MAEALKRFVARITTSKTKERCEIFEDLQPILSKSDLPEATLKGILKTCVFTLSRYRNAKSRIAVDKIFEILAGEHDVAACKNIVSALAPITKDIRNGAKSTCADESFKALGWTCILIRCGKDGCQGDVLKQMLDLQASLVYGALTARRLVQRQAVYKRLCRLWTEAPQFVEKYCEWMKSSESNIYKLTLCGLLVQFLVSTKATDTLTKYRDSFIETYTKSVLSGRSRPAKHAMEACRPLLKLINHAEFKESVLPALQKAMLRSPEVTVEAAGYLVEGVSIDLSQYAMEIGKNLASQLHAKEERIRDDAVVAIEKLGKQCSDSDAVSKLVKHIIAIYNGSEGKLVVVAEKISVLSGLGRLSSNQVTGSQSVSSLGTTVVESFIPILQQEVHEATLIHTIQMLSLWVCRFSTDLPKKLIEWFKTGLGLKSSTSGVRMAYIQCMNAAFQGDCLIQAMDVLPVLLKTVDKASSQSTQHGLVSEALSAACLLLKLSTVDIQAEAKLGPFWTVVLDMKNDLFMNDKFVQQASEETILCMCTYIERLLLEHPQRLTDKLSQQLYKGMIFVLTRPAWRIRKQGQSSTKRILSALGGANVALGLLAQFRNFISTQQPIDWEIYDETEHAKCIKPGILAACVQTICQVPGCEPAAAGSIVLHSLIDAHHPCIVMFNGDCWVEIASLLNVDILEFLKNNLQTVMASIKNQTPLTQDYCNALTTLSRVAPKLVLPEIIKQITESLSNSRLATVTREEYAIMMYPEGKLYNTSVIEGGKNEGGNANVRKESKLYSYKEQMAEKELRKIEEEKKRKRGEKTEPKLNKKQQELMAAELKKESEIRKVNLQLDEDLCKTCAMLASVVNGDSLELRLYLPELLTKILPLMKSALAAPRLSKTFLQLQESAFYMQSQTLGDLVTHASLRIFDPTCDLESGWADEPIKLQAIRAVNHLYQNCIHLSEDEMEEDKITQLPAPTFAFCFALLRAILKDGGSLVGGSEVTIQRVLSIMKVHAQLRDDGDGELNEMGPELLPRPAMLEVLVDVIATGNNKLQTSATECLLEVASCASGNEGCSAAEEKEISILLSALLSPVMAVREAALQGLHFLSMVLPTLDINFEQGLQVTQRILVAKYDCEELNRNLAEKVWTDTGLELSPELCSLLIEDVSHNEKVVREAAAQAMAQVAKEYSEQIQTILQLLMVKYQDKLYMPPPVLDSVGRVICEQPPDEWPARCGVAQAMRKLSALLSDENIETVMSFMVPEALGDRDENVRQAMREAAVQIVNDHGKEEVTILLPVFEEFLEKAPDSAKYDAVRQSVVVLLGSLAKHLDKTDPKVKPIVAKLIEALSTPSQQVQEAVANCLPPLVPAIKADAPELVSKLLQLLLESDNYGERKGAAYGLAGLVKGLGILALKQLNIMDTLTEAIQNKKSPRYREGALFAFEMLCTMLGRLFEPYVVHILPHLLLCFGDGNQYVRQAADDCAKAVMSKLSAHGVKLVLPSLLTAIEEDSWRTKTGSVELLGAMAFCAPKQLSACLPSIVPKLTEVLTDSHMKVQKAGEQALKQIGSVIRNPEIQSIVHVLLDALQNPTKRTTTCLATLLETKFVHFIDAASLALIMPVVQRAFQDRSTETRKMAAQIIGNMYSLTDQKDLQPYLPSVIPGLKASLLDPVPEVRTVSSRALGAMVKGMGETSFEELLPWLMLTLTSEQSSVDRSGAAQGLSEVVGGLGLEKLDKLMPDIVQTAERLNIAPHVRDGYIMMYIYLPNVFKDAFIPYIGQIIPSILIALADECEFVRDTALRAGQRIVNMYADTAIVTLLPELEKGLFDDNWRIRSSSVQLLGDLLYKISGVSGKMTTTSAHEDDNFGTEGSQQTIVRVLGLECRNRVLAGLYMGRSDTALLVRQSALHVWKVIVSNTPKTLREILSTLFQLLLGCLASTSYDKRQVAARTLGDIVRKLGERVLPEIIPILERGLESEESDQRQGVCIGLTEIMTSTSREHVLAFADSLVPTVRKALCDPLAEVREAAADTFDHLHGNIGVRALDEILPDLLEKLGEDEEGEHALDGLKQVMAVKSRVVLPYMVPQLTREPVNTRALSYLSAVAGEELNRHLGKILPALMKSLSSKFGTPDEQEELQYCENVVLSVSSDAGLRYVMDELLAATNTSNMLMCASAVTILYSYTSKTKADYSDYIPQLLRCLLHLYTKSDERVLEASWNCLNAITKSLDAADMLNHISNVRQAVRFALSDYRGEHLPGFCLPKKGIAPILPIFREGILNGPPDLKESAAVGLGEVIKFTSPIALKPSVLNITGPLIRILGDRFSWNVKVALLDTLTLLLSKCGVMLKSFLPQLQTTFIKALNDPNRAVRLKAADAISQLILIHSRVDTLFTELHNGVKAAEDSGIRDTMLQALRGCIEGAKTKMGDAIRKQLYSTLEGLLNCKDDQSRLVAAGCLGALTVCMTDDEVMLLINQHFLDMEDDWVLRHGRAVALGVGLKVSAEKLLVPQHKTAIQKAILDNIAHDRMPVVLSGLRALGYLLRHQFSCDVIDNSLVTTLTKCMKNESNDVKQLTSQVMTYIALSKDEGLPVSALKIMVPCLVNGTKEKNTVVKSTAETASVAILRINKQQAGDTTLKTCLSSLDPGMREALNEVVGKVHHKQTAQPTGRDEDIDDTLLS